MSIVYLDNAATSWPKPPAVAEAMSEFLASSAGNPGRGGHQMARAAADAVEVARSRIARVVGCSEPERIVLTHGCTDALNLAIHGVLRAACAGQAHRPHVVTSAIEHNAVLRTLHWHAVNEEIDLTIVPCDSTAAVHPEAVAAACTDATVLVCVSHASNAAGTIQDIRGIRDGLRAGAPEALLLVDAAQTVGHVPLDVEADGIDLVAIAGHKGLRGPTGTGALYVGPRVVPADAECAAWRIVCERRGGTGAPVPGLNMPPKLPDAMEAGTLNAVGFVGLTAAIDQFNECQRDRESRATDAIIGALRSMRHVEVYGRDGTDGRTPVVLFNIRGRRAREVAAELDDRHAIAVRGGVHCAPLLHDVVGTGPDGGVRASPGPATTDGDVDAFIGAVAALA